MSKVVAIKQQGQGADEQHDGRLLVTLDAEALREIIRQEIRAATGKPEKILYTPEEAAELLSLKKSWLLSAARYGEINCTRKRHYVRFTKEQIRAIAETSSPIEKRPRKKNKNAHEGLDTPEQV